MIGGSDAFVVLYCFFLTRLRYCDIIDSQGAILAAQLAMDL